MLIFLPKIRQIYLCCIHLHGQLDGKHVRLRPPARAVAGHAAHGQRRRHHGNEKQSATDSRFSTCRDSIECFPPGRCLRHKHLVLTTYYLTTYYLTTYYLTTYYLTTYYLTTYYLTTYHLLPYYLPLTTLLLTTLPLTTLTTYYLTTYYLLLTTYRLADLNIAQLRLFCYFCIHNYLPTICLYDTNVSTNTHTDT